MLQPFRYRGNGYIQMWTIQLTFSSDKKGNLEVENNIAPFLLGDHVFNSRADRKQTA